MSGLSRRFEILLPLKSNDGQPFPEDLLADVVLALERQFGAVSSETQIIRGLWEKQGMTFRDELVRVFVDVPDLPENRQFFIDFKERLKSLFGQLDIWVTTYPIEIL